MLPKGNASIEVRAFSVSQIFFPSPENICQYEVDIAGAWVHFALT
jgi:hypothetical protein